MRINTFLTLIFALFFIHAGAGFTEPHAHQTYQKWKQAQAAALSALDAPKATLKELETHEAEILKWRLHWQEAVEKTSQSDLANDFSLLRNQLKSLEDSSAKTQGDVETIDLLKEFLQEEIVQQQIPFLQAKIASLSADTLATELSQKIYIKRMRALFTYSAMPFGLSPFSHFWDNKDGAFSNGFIDFTLYPRALGNIAENLETLFEKGAFFSQLRANGLFTAFYQVIAFLALAWFVSYFLRANDGHLLKSYWPRLRTNLMTLAGCFGAHHLITQLGGALQLSLDAQILLEMVPLALSCLFLDRFTKKFNQHSVKKDHHDFIQRIDIALCILIKWSLPLIILLFLAQRANASIALAYALIPTLMLYLFLKVIWRKITRLCRLLNFTKTHDTHKSAKETKGLLPIFINILLTIATLPVFALIWGARRTDLINFWRDIEAGITVGGISITPQNVTLFLIIFLIAYAVVKTFQYGLQNAILPQTGINQGLQNAISSGFGYIGISLAAIIAITTAGINLSSLAIIAGALSIGIGFGLQNIVSNFVSGIILLLERPIAEGDWIDAGGYQGYVRNIAVRSTRIEAFDRSEFIIPNSDLISNAVTNYTKANNYGRLILPVGVGYDSDTRKVEEILVKVGEASPYRLKTSKPTVIFKKFGESALEFELRIILRNVNDILSAQSEINHDIVARFREAGIKIPFPHRELITHGAPPL